MVYIFEDYTRYIGIRFIVQVNWLNIYLREVLDSQSQLHHERSLPLVISQGSLLVIHYFLFFRRVCAMLFMATK